MNVSAQCGQGGDLTFATSVSVLTEVSLARLVGQFFPEALSNAPAVLTWRWIHALHGCVAAPCAHAVGT